MLEGIFVEGLIYAIMALGVFFTFRILDFPDLTVDGSFPMGAVIMATSLTGGCTR
jgi:putative ABC transport system permease protein